MSLSRRNEIIRRANVEFEEAIHRYQALRAALLEQQRTALSGIPAAKKALDVYETALAAAFEDYQLKLAAAEAEVLGAESEAVASQHDDETTAQEVWQLATEDADVARRVSAEDAEQAFEDVFRNAKTTAAQSREAQIAAARTERDAALRTATRKYELDTDKAWRLYQRSLDDAREDAIAAVEKARRTQAAAGETAAAAFHAKERTVEAALAKALQADPAAAAIQQAFAHRLADAEVQSDREKAEIIARMKKDLADASA